MATWVRSFTANLTGTANTALAGPADLSSDTAPASFNPALVNSVRFQFTLSHTGTFATSGSDSFALQPVEIETTGGTQLADVSPTGTIQLGTATVTIDLTDVAPNVGASTVDWEGARFNGITSNLITNFTQSKGADGVTPRILAASVTITIDFVGVIPLPGVGSAASAGSGVLTGQVSQPVELALKPSLDPVSSYHTMSVRARGDGTGGTMRVRLLQGATQRASWTETVTTSWTTFAHQITTGEADAITDYTALRVEISQDTPSTTAWLQVSWIEFELDSLPAGGPSGAGTIVFTGTGTGTPVHFGEGAGTLVFTGDATGTLTKLGSGAGTVTFTGEGTGAVTRYGEAAGTFTFAGTGTGTRTALGAGSGTVEFTGTGTGTVVRFASGSGTVTFAGEATGTTLRYGEAAGTIAFAGSGTGTPTRFATAAGTVEFSGTGTGSVTRLGAAAGTVEFAGVVAGTFTGPRFVLTGTGMLVTANVNLLDADTSHIHQSQGLWLSNNGTLFSCTRSTEYPMFGSASLKFVVLVDGNNPSAYNSTRSPVVAGQTYSVGAMVHYPSKSGQARFALSWYDAVSANISTSYGAYVPVVAGVDTWVAGEGLVAPANAVSAYISCFNVFDGGSLVGDVAYNGMHILREGSDGSWVPSFQIVRDIDMRVGAAADNWIPSPSQMILSTWNVGVGDGFSGYSVGVGNLGTILATHGDGTSDRVEQSSLFDSVNGVANQIRVTYDIDTGDAVYYQHGVQIDTDVFPTGVASPSGLDFTVGDVYATGVGLSGDIHDAYILDGIGGPTVIEFAVPTKYGNIAALPDGLTFEYGGRVWTVDGAVGIAGKTFDSHFEDGAGTVVFSGTATGAVTRYASAAGSIVLTGTATGARTAVGEGAGTVALTGTATGLRTAVGEGAGTVTFTVTATGTPTKFATAAGTVEFSGTATGSGTAGTIYGEGAGTVTFTGTATGTPTHLASAAGTVTFDGSATGTPVRLGEGTGTVTFTGTATGAKTVYGSASGTVTFTATATGNRTAFASGSGTVTFTATATGTPTRFAAGSGTIIFTGTATSTQQLVRPISTITVGGWDTAPTAGQLLYVYTSDESETTYIFDSTA